ncbi:Resuscitation promoting factor (fragment) [Phycicoccus elongatus Lp2]|uniref:Resuscitation promoting factor n=1 Tax=Phycicoccus elongatus Lp2 TaxID=1193181 RepID=N0E6D9_9MICO
MGPRRPVRVRRQLEHQHRQRLLRRPAVLLPDLARQRRWRLRPACRPGHPGAADHRRQPALRLLGPGPVELQGLSLLTTTPYAVRPPGRTAYRFVRV